MLEIRITLQRAIAIVNRFSDPKLIRDALRKGKTTRNDINKLVFRTLYLIDSLTDASREFVNVNNSNSTINSFCSDSNNKQNQWSEIYKLYWERLEFIEAGLSKYQPAYSKLLQMNKILTDKESKTIIREKGKNIKCLQHLLNRSLSKRSLRAFLDLPLQLNNCKLINETSDAKSNKTGKKGNEKLKMSLLQKHLLKKSIVDDCKIEHETYYDGNFYQNIIKEFFKTGSMDSPILKNVHRKNLLTKKNLSKRFSKCRRLNYRVQEKLVNYMTPTLLPKDSDSLSTTHFFGESINH
jgi:hypothetical protein